MKNNQLNNTFKNLSLQISSKNYVMIPKDAIESYKSSATATISMNDCHYISIMGNVVKDERIEGVEYETIYANEISDFDPKKILVVLKESYILKASFDNNDRGGHQMNELYVCPDDFWENPTYRNLCKIAFYLETFEEYLNFDNVDWKDKAIRTKACDAFKKHFQLVSILPFPGLAFNGTKTDMKTLREWMKTPEVKERLAYYVKELNPRVIYSGGVDLGLYCSYPDTFGWLKGRKLEELKQYESNLTILDQEITYGNIDIYPYVMTPDHKKWVNGVHPAKRNLSNEDIKKIALMLTIMLNF